MVSEPTVNVLKSRLKIKVINWSFNYLIITYPEINKKMGQQGEEDLNDFIDSLERLMICVWDLQIDLTRKIIAYEEDPQNDAV